jgi:protein ImuB
MALHFDELPLSAAIEAAAVTKPIDSETQPLAVTDDDPRRTVIACNAVAARFGVRPQHSLNAAIALCAHTTFLPRQLEREAAQLQAAARACERYTSTVSMEAPNELLLEIRGSFRLFGGVQGLVDQVQLDFKAIGRMLRVSISASARSALWLSRIAAQPLIVMPRALPATLARLPISVLLWPAEVELRLARFGTLTVGDLLRLPRGGLARRIGPERLAELDEALGRRPSVRERFRGEARFSDRLLLEFEVETTQLLAHFIERRLSRLEQFLVKRQLAAEHVILELKHRDAPTTEVKIGLAAATANVAHIVKLMHEHLSKLTLCAPVRDVVIRVDRLLPAPATSLPLFASITTAQSNANRRDDQARLLEHLRARLGENAIGRITSMCDYRPERGHSVPTAAIEAASSEVSPPVTLAKRPFWLLKSPRPLSLRPGARRPQHLLRGPELIEAGWWDEQAVHRAYYHARSPDGALAWISRDRDTPDDWHLHGLFG